MPNSEAFNWLMMTVTSMLVIMKVRLTFMMSRVKKSSVADCERAPPPGASSGATFGRFLESVLSPSDTRCADKFTVILNTNK